MRPLSLSDLTESHIDIAPGSARPGRRFDSARAEAAIRELLFAIGENPDREGLEDTPKRVARMWKEVLAGEATEPESHLRRTFAEKHDDVVMVRQIEFASMCEHHMLPFLGQAHVAYIPSGRVVGLSKVARTVEVFARRLQLQERLTDQVADAFVKYLAPRGVLVLVESKHMCMQMRGVQKRGSSMVTIAARGVLREDRAQRREVLDLLRHGA